MELFIYIICNIINSWNNFILQYQKNIQNMKTTIKYIKNLSLIFTISLFVISIHSIRIEAGPAALQAVSKNIQPSNQNSRRQLSIIQIQQDINNTLSTNDTLIATLYNFERFFFNKIYPNSVTYCQTILYTTYIQLLTTQILYNVQTPPNIIQYNSLYSQILQCVNVSGGIYASAFNSQNSYYNFTNSSSGSPSVLVTGLCKNKVVNQNQNSYMIYTNSNNQTYNYSIPFPTLSGSYYTSTFNDNSFGLPSGTYTMQISGWCGSDTINPFINKII